MLGGRVRLGGVRLGRLPGRRSAPVRLPDVPDLAATGQPRRHHVVDAWLAVVRELRPELSDAQEVTLVEMSLAICAWGALAVGGDRACHAEAAGVRPPCPRLAIADIDTGAPSRRSQVARGAVLAPVQAVPEMVSSFVKRHLANKMGAVLTFLGGDCGVY